ncbi:MAG: site-specific integrase [Bacteroidota bacterium]|nr:site-specific integrase [Bacteroidota bacterium]
MATFKAMVHSHHEKEDGTFNIKIRVIHNRKKAYNNTTYFVTKSQLTKKLDLKDRNIINKTNDLIKDYYDQANKMGEEINLYSVKDLAAYLERKVSKLGDDTIDFVRFGNSYIKNLIKSGQGSYAAKFTRAVNHLVDFFGREKVMITEINVNNLHKLEDFLKTPRDYVRLNQVGKPVTYHSDGAKNGVIDTMGCIRKLFNEAKKEYNDEDRNDIRITHSPFVKYIVGKAPEESEKRNLKPKEIMSIRDFQDVKLGSRMELGRDVFMLSFYLIGMNTADLFNVTDIKGGRLEYKRAKTTGRRKDNAFISIKVEREAQALIDKYRDPTNKRVFNFHRMYSNSKLFNSMLNVGLQSLAVKLELPEDLTSYYARHSWATIARNVCRISMDDVSMALNHIDPAHQVTDIYIEKNWSIIDEANRKVLDTIKEKVKDDHDYLLEDPETVEDILQAMRENTL